MAQLFLLISLIILQLSTQTCTAKTQFFFVRHGQTDANVHDVLQGQSDTPLNEQGKQEAKALQKKLADIPFSICLSSDLQRASETASIIIAGRPLEVVKDSRLRERSYGIFEMRPNKDYEQATKEELGTVETKEALRKRIIDFLDYAVQSSYADNVLIVSHGGFMRHVLTYMLDLSPDRTADIAIKNTAFFKAYFSGTAWVVEELDGITVPETKHVIVESNNTAHAAPIKPVQRAPLLVVTVMIKNEAHAIGKTLQPFVDAGVKSYVIFDTGSTDNTVDVVKNYFKQQGIADGYIFQEPFVDFATSRNRALALTEQQFPHAHFMIMPDAEWYLEQGASLIEFCKKHKNDSFDAYLIRINADDGQDFYIPRLMRPKAHLRFFGVVHEDLKVKRVQKVPQETYFKVRSTKKGLDARKNRFTCDLTLLSKEHAKNPDDSRTIYFLAQTYIGLGEYARAYDYYRLCVTKSLPNKNKSAEYWRVEQAYQACYMAGSLVEELLKTNPAFSWDMALSNYLHACTLDPKRAEPLMRIARHYWDEGSMEMCFMFARQAAELPYPVHVVGNLEHDVYSFTRYELLGACAGNCGKWDMSEWALNKALESKPDAEYLKKNREFVLTSKQAVVVPPVVDQENCYYEYQNV